MGYRPRLRALVLLVHRYVGLSMSVFLIVAGATGSMIAFYPQVDRFINPELLAVEPPRLGAPLLDPFTVRERLLDQLPQGQSVDGVVLYRTPGLPFNYWIDDREVFVDPFTGTIRGSRHFGDL
ncbi:MAG TPA: PepSY-associated TM helix domain-containing protein, partial [Polyangiaceae bacterium]|nr:PepSY-associated TM helix domain-containing protein [Polyangiaceae bacterium]